MAISLIDGQNCTALPREKHRLLSFKYYGYQFGGRNCSTQKNGFVSTAFWQDTDKPDPIRLYHVHIAMGSRRTVFLSGQVRFYRLQVDDTDI